MQVEKDIVVARDFIEGNVYEKTGYRPVKLFSSYSKMAPCLSIHSYSLSLYQCI